jgi:hypothetical protein
LLSLHVLLHKVDDLCMRVTRTYVNDKQRVRGIIPYRKFSFFFFFTLVNF